MALATEEVVWPEDVDIPDAALGLVEKTELYQVPDAYLEEILASEMVQYLRSYHTAVVARRTARHMGDNKRAEEMSKVIAGARNAIALIHHEHPAVRPLAESIMKLESSRARRVRADAEEE